MSTAIQKITPFLWFDHEAEEAAHFYTSIFDDAAIGKTTRYGEEGARVSGQPPGSVMTIAFRLAGQEFVALNGGPHFTFSPAISFVVRCDSQTEVDRYWDQLAAGGEERAQQCGWLQDRYGVSWQIVPAALDTLLDAAEPQRASRVMQALLKMKKLDIEALERAWAGGPQITATHS
ncbi:MAG: VOC family protein [Betaproteobacteria bacterium]|nr:VOC family protein [Betaproteobacteria bacterium]